MPVATKHDRPFIQGSSVRSTVSLLVILAELLALTSPLPATAQATFKDVGGERMGFTQKGDPLMEEAKRKARATLPEFLALLKAPRPSITGMAVKIGIPYGRNDHEFFWVMDLAINDGQITGRLGNTPRFATSVSAGQMLRFTEADVVDWLYREDGAVKGNYTSCALIAREPKERREVLAKQFSANCEF
jgi:uncharacterized protein YegJ (DUF2314 family)